MRHLLLVASCLVCAATLAQEGREGHNYRSLPFTLEHVNERVVPADMDGNGLKDVLTADGSRLSVYFQTPSSEEAEAFDFSQPSAVLELPGRATGWALDKLAAPQKSGAGQRIMALVDGERLMAWTLGDDGFGKAETLIEKLPGFLPAGAYPADFVRDVNGDGLSDVVVPGRGELHLYLQDAQGGYSDGLEVQSRMSNFLRISPENDLTERVGQRIRIPEMSIRDVNNDQRKDLIASSEERVEVFIADESGRFPNAASYAIDLTELKERVGEVDIDQVDYSNLSGLLAHTYNIQLEDVDGDRIDDLLVREGGKLTLFGGTSDGMDMSEPRQVLKSSGNVLGATLRDEDDDGLKDLWLIRVEDVSLGNLFLWLAVSGSIDIETFVYKNQGERFASRPHRKVTVSVKFPSILRSVDMVTAAMEPQADVDVVRTVRAQMRDSTARRNLVVLRQKSLAVFMDAIGEDDSQGFLGLPNYSRDKNDYVYDLGKVLENPASGPSRDLRKVADRDANFQIAFHDDFSPDLKQADVFAWDMNSDGQDDFFVMSEREESSVAGLLLLSH